MVPSEAGNWQRRNSQKWYRDEIKRFWSAIEAMSVRVESDMHKLGWFYYSSPAIAHLLFSHLLLELIRRWLTPTLSKSHFLDREEKVIPLRIIQHTLNSMTRVEVQNLTRRRTNSLWLEFRKVILKGGSERMGVIYAEQPSLWGGTAPTVSYRPDVTCFMGAEFTLYMTGGYLICCGVPIRVEWIHHKQTMCHLPFFYIRIKLTSVKLLHLCALFRFSFTTIGQSQYGNWICCLILPGSCRHS